MVRYYNKNNMSLKKGYNYENVKKYCEKYNCKLLSTKEEIDLKPKNFTIESSCGHNSTVPFHKLFRQKQGIYCVDCFNDMDEAKCFKCGEMFEHTEKLFLYCSRACSHSHDVTEEHKQKLRDTFYEKLCYDENGELMNDDEINEMKKERKKKRERKRARKRKRKGNEAKEQGGGG